MTKIEIIDETAVYYSEDVSRRAYNPVDGRCTYLDPKTGNKCAVGRCMNKKANFKTTNSISCYTGNSFFDSQDEFLQDKYKGHDIDFWQDLQYFHDKDSYWQADGLSEIGQRKYESLKEKYANN